MSSSNHFKGIQALFKERYSNKNITGEVPYKAPNAILKPQKLPNYGKFRNLHKVFKEKKLV